MRLPEYFVCQITAAFPVFPPGGGGGDSAGPRTPTTPAPPSPPPLGAFGQQLVARGVAPRRLRCPMLHEHQRCPKENFVQFAHLTLTRTEYWDRAGGERNITFKAFCDFRRAKIAYNGLKMGSFHLFVHPKRSSHHFGKKGF